MRANKRFQQREISSKVGESLVRAYIVDDHDTACR